MNTAYLKRCADEDRRAKIAAGFTIDGMNMRDASTGEMLWEMNSWPSDWHVAEIQARVPARILQCPVVSRELTFSSVEKVANLRCEHRVYLDGAPDPIEVWDFDFGFVMPGSRNTWQTTVEAAGGEKMLSPTEASGRVTVRTKFTDGDATIVESAVRVFYEND